MQRKKGARIVSFLLAALVTVSALPISVLANETTTGSDKVEFSSSESLEVPSGKVAVRLESIGGSVSLKVTDQDKYTTNKSVELVDGKALLKDNLTGEESTVETDSEYPLVLEEEVGTVVEVSVTPNEGYDVSTYSILSDSGEVLSSVDAEELKGDGYSQSLAISDELKVISVDFEADSSKVSDDKSNEDLNSGVVQKDSDTSESTEKETSSNPDKDLATVDENNSTSSTALKKKVNSRASDIDYNNGISLMSAGWDDIGAAPNTHVIQRGFTVDGDYKFCPTVTSATTITFGGANWDNTWCVRSQQNLNVVTRYWPQADVTNWSNTRSVTLSDSMKGNLYVDFKNVGEYQGEQVNMRIVFTNWEVYNNIPKSDYPQMIVTTGYGDGFPCIDNVCVKWVETRFEYYRNDGSSVSLKGHYTMNDLDYYQGFKVINNGATVALYTNQDAANRMGYDSSTGIIWSDASGTSPDNDNGWVTYLFNGSNTVMRWYSGDMNPKFAGYSITSDCAKWSSAPEAIRTNLMRYYTGASTTWVTEPYFTTWNTSEFGYFAEASVSFSSKANVQVTKTDSSTGEKLAGATFTCYEWNGNGWTNIGNLSWNSSAKYYYKNGMEKNSTNGGRFRVEETANPSGYSGTWSQEFTITNSGTVTLKYTATNTRKTGTITINKTDAETGSKISGAQFQIIAKEDIRTGGGTVLVTKGTVIQTLTVSNGTARSQNLEYGQYTVKEVKAAPGYVMSSASQDVTVGDGNTNVTVSFKNNPVKVRLDLYKTGSNTDLTNNNRNYSLQGAVYSIYTNSACTNLYAQITTDASGHAYKDDMPLGVYYVKETTAPKGYQLNSTVHKVDMSNSNQLSYRLDVVDTPYSDPISLLLKKQDAKTGDKAQGNATLEGAQFEVKFYDLMSDTDPALSGETPLRTWIFQTVTTPSGTTLVNYSQDCLISGDNLFYQGNVASLPYGTITIKEVVAPEGYLLNDTTFVAKVGETLGLQPVYHEPIIPEQALSIDITKVQAGTTTPISGVTFKHSGPDGFTETAVTDQNGKVSFNGLTYGNHTIEETKTVDGYALNTQKITFTVNRDNTIKITSSSTVTDTNGNIKVSVGADGNIDAVVENKPAPYTLHVYKTNNHNFALQGAEFTLYSDATCKTAVDKQSTNSSGNLNFNNLIVGKTYYLKETKAPQGYRISVNDDGSDIVWTIKAESTPVNGVFTFYVNGKTYTTSSTGSYTVTGTVANRVANMTVINEVGLKLPNTGSNGMIILVAVGLVLVAGGLFLRRKQK